MSLRLRSASSRAEKRALIEEWNFDLGKAVDAAVIAATEKESGQNV